MSKYGLFNRLWVGDCRYIWRDVAQQASFSGEDHDRKACGPKMTPRIVFRSILLFALVIGVGALIKFTPLGDTLKRSLDG